MHESKNPFKGRGSQVNPPNRFVAVRCEDDFADLEHDPDFFAAREHPDTQYLPDASQSVVTENDSPDVGFRYSLNPYRGCTHGCSYCYARPTHEYLGYSGGLDFETRVLVKHKAAQLLRAFLARPSWRPAPIVMSGVTDCYQPAERRFGLTRQCLEVALAARQPLCIITKNALVLRDLDLLTEMAKRSLVHVSLSVTTLDARLARTMEPRTSSPEGRLRAIRECSAAGIPVRAMIAPVIPGLTDHELPAILRAAREAGAGSAGYVFLRLPHCVLPVFQEWLAREESARQPKVEALLRAARGGKLNDAAFGSRMRGTGAYAEQIAATFRVFARQTALDDPLPELDASQFVRPDPDSRQRRLFD